MLTLLPHTPLSPSFEMFQGDEQKDETVVDAEFKEKDEKDEKDEEKK